MGGICNCDAKTSNNQYNNFTFSQMRDPRLSDLLTHLKILDSKLNSGLTTIEDFEQLLIETKKESVTNKDIQMTIQAIEQALTEQQTIFKQIQQTKIQAKIRLEQADIILSQKLQRGKNTDVSRDNIYSTNNNLTPIGKYHHQSTGSSSDLDRSQDAKNLIDGIYRTITDIVKQLRRAEEEAQVQMLKWENFVIQHEKMQKLREDIQESFKQQNIKIGEVKSRDQSLKELIIFFQRICLVIENTQNDSNFSNINSSLNNDDNSFDLGRQSSSIFHDSFEDQEKDDEFQEILELKEKISSYLEKLEAIEKSFEKYQLKLQVFKQKREEINDYDIYELDSFYKESQDQINKIDIIQHKINDMAGNLKNKYGNGYTLVDICEQVFQRKIEVKSTLKMVISSQKLCEKLLANQIKSKSDQQNGGVSQLQGVQRCLIQLKKIEEKLEINSKKLQRIEQLEEIKLNDIDQIEVLMIQLIQIQKENNEAHKNLFDENGFVQKLYVLKGGLGWRIDVTSLGQRQSKKIDKIKKKLVNLITTLDESNKAQLSVVNHTLIDEQVRYHNEDKQQVKINVLREKSKILLEQIGEIETNIDRWLDQQKVGDMIVIQGNELDEQEWQVQEYINILSQVSNLKYIFQKLEMNIQKSQRKVLQQEIYQILSTSKSNIQQLQGVSEAIQEQSKKVEDQIGRWQQLLMAYQDIQPHGTIPSSSSNDNIRLSFKNALAGNLSGSPLEINNNDKQSEDKEAQFNRLMSNYNASQQTQKALEQSYKNLYQDIIHKFQESVLQYSRIFESEEESSQLVQKCQLIDQKIANTMKQVKMINQELNEIYIHFKHQEGGSKSMVATNTGGFKIKADSIMSFNGIPFTRQYSIGPDNNPGANNGFKKENEAQQKLLLEQSLSQMDDQSNQSMVTARLAMDEVDQALYKCVEEQKCFRNIRIQKLRDGVYQVEKREYKFKLLQGGNLAIRMFAGYIFTDCLVHFDEEFLHLVLS
ncbi:UNKNOWN [Stylonychia lemnae]|uniref:Uncharacterized protein n=1 Tax=Stylonychia lemnae TaxID=5949 RepID=A0A078AHM4_STYLE|nr:UNKNOWN [Stylonychia lemnae]|eukprot:CDW80328.1 UNKNOWN [Stylonychia lemnae]